MLGHKKYLVTWTQKHQIEVLATSEDDAIIYVIVSNDDLPTQIKSENFEVKEIK